VPATSANKNYEEDVDGIRDEKKDSCITEKPDHPPTPNDYSG